MPYTFFRHMAMPMSSLLASSSASCLSSRTHVGPVRGRTEPAGRNGHGSMAWVRKTTIFRSGENHSL